MKTDKKLIIPQKAVIKKGDRYLILLRSKSETAFPGMWDFPGGKLELGEEPFLGVEREVREETGLVVKAEKVVFTYDYERPDDVLHFVLYAVTVVVGDLERITLSKEHSEFRFATREEILELPAMPYMFDFLNKQS